MAETITMRDLWDDFAGRGLVECETDAEIALQKAAFASGAMAAIGNACQGKLLDPDTVYEFLIEACSKIHLTVDRQLARPAYPAASEQ